MNAKNSRKAAQRVMADLSKIAISAPVPANTNRNNTRGLQGQQRLRGRGGYYADAGRSRGANLGSQLGSAAGAMLGAKAGSVVDTLIGRGDYSVRKNSIMTHSQGVPSFTNSSRNRDDHAIVLEHREFVCDVIATGSTNFSVQQTYALNPALASTFAYASQLASAFEEWEPEGIVWCYESTSGSISTTQGLGTIVMATQYDSSDPAFTTQIEMLDYQFSSSACPDTSFLHPVECDPRSNASTPRLFCRTGAFQGDINLFDLGKTTIATVGVPAAANVVLGKLWCIYRIKLLKPKLFASLLGNSIGYSSWTGSTNVTAGQAFGNSTESPIGTIPYLGIDTPGGIGSLWAARLGVFTGNSSFTNAVYFGYPNMPTGVYRFTIIHTGTVAPTAVQNWTTSMDSVNMGNCRRSTVNRFNGGTTNFQGNQSTTSTVSTLQFDLEVGPYNPAGSRCPFIQWVPYFQTNCCPTGGTPSFLIQIQQIPTTSVFKA